jgi:hypothetical protein
MADELTQPRPKCPLCGEPAEAGCLYGRDGGWASFTGLQWRAGEPSIAGNIIAGMRGGEAVGEFKALVGPFVRGIKCQRCRRIVLEIDF